MKSDYEENLIDNFNKALSLCVGTHSREDVFEMLKNGNIVEKQFAALEINDILSQNEAEIFISNLTGCDGKIREAVAYKFQNIVQDKTIQKYFFEYPEIFAKATIDINANVCRMILDGLKLLQYNEIFSKKYVEKIIQFTQDAFDELDKFIFRDKKYTINKQLFKLYWCLEAVNIFYKNIDISILEKILANCLSINEYTIREKAALILKNDIHSLMLDEIRLKLKKDENYYVKNV